MKFTPTPNPNITDVKMGINELSAAFKGKLGKNKLLIVVVIRSETSKCWHLYVVTDQKVVVRLKGSSGYSAVPPSNPVKQVVDRGEVSPATLISDEGNGA